MRRYLRLLWVQARVSLQTAMHYRIDFLVEGAISVLSMGVALLPLVVVYSGRDDVAGWSFAEALVVIAWFTLLRSVLEGAINPSLQQIVEHIRTGTLDFVLLKPADAQFLVSTARFVPWKIVDALAGFVVLGVALHRLGHVPSLTEAGGAAVLLLASVLVLYSLWILVVSAAFWVVKVDNLTYLFSSIFDAARWPLQVFRGVWRILFTFVIPLGLMTTYPAMSILGTLETATALYAIGGALVFALLARVVWLRSLGRYTSASS